MRWRIHHCAQVKLFLRAHPNNCNHEALPTYRIDQVPDSYLLIHIQPELARAIVIRGSREYSWPGVLLFGLTIEHCIQAAFHQMPAASEAHAADL
jgi:hypothetical protein